MITTNDLQIPTLGPCERDSPFHRLMSIGECAPPFVDSDERIVFHPYISKIQAHQSKGEAIPSLEIAGPRAKVFFDAEQSKAAIVTCGGLCPGINDVIRGIVMELHFRYGVPKIYGVPYGYQGFIEEYGHPLTELTPQSVGDIHKLGGTMLASSRGRQETSKIVDLLDKNKINMLFVIGGDGTLRAALEISQAAEKRKNKLSVIGIPKTVDNDILYIDRSFGLATACSEAVKAVSSAHTEAQGALNGIGLVKLMGRHSGFIACYTTLAMNDVNFVLIPEVPFELEGENGFLPALKNRLKKRGHAVVVVAEGAGQDLIEGEKKERDASGNIRFKDIGLFLKHNINEYFKRDGTEVNLKYIDPSYIIRSVPAAAGDSVYCLHLAQHAVHAAMSGRTRMVVGLRHGKYVHLPMALVASGRRTVDPTGGLWLSVLEATGQPIQLGKVCPIPSGRED